MSHINSSIFYRSPWTSRRTKILNILPEKSSLFETILVSINDKLVELFLDNRIKYTDISKKMHNMLRLNDLKKYKMNKVKSIKDIISPLTKSISKNILDEIYPYLYLSFIFVVVSFFLHLGILILLLRS